MRIRFKRFLTLASLLTLVLKPGPLSANPALPSIPIKTFEVTAYGAVGDGTSTNTAAIQRAIAAAAAAGGGVLTAGAAAAAWAASNLTAVMTGSPSCKPSVISV